MINQFYSTSYGEPLTIAFAIITVIVSGGVLVSGLMFRNLMNNMLMRIIFTIALCDFISSIAVSWGFVGGSSPWCPIQGGLVVFFFRASWFWTACLSHQLFCLVLNKDYTIPETYAHIIIWSASLVLELSPLATNAYGQDDEGSSNSYCFLKFGTNPKSSAIWIISTFDIPLYFTLVIILFYYVSIRFFHNDSLFRSVADSMLYYPLAMLFTWLPVCILEVYILIGNANINDSTFKLLVIFQAVSVLYGALLGIIFFMRSNEARQCWYQLLCLNGKDMDSVISVDFPELGEQQQLWNARDSGGVGAYFSSRSSGKLSAGRKSGLIGGDNEGTADSAATDNPMIDTESANINTITSANTASNKKQTMTMTAPSRSSSAAGTMTMTATAGTMEQLEISSSLLEGEHIVSSPSSSRGSSRGSSHMHDLSTHQSQC